MLSHKYLFVHLLLSTLRCLHQRNPYTKSTIFSPFRSPSLIVHSSLSLSLSLESLLDSPDLLHYCLFSVYKTSILFSSTNMSLGSTLLLLYTFYTINCFEEIKTVFDSFISVCHQMPIVFVKVLSKFLYYNCLLNHTC